MDIDTGLSFSENEQDDETIFLSVRLNYHHKMILDYLRRKITEGFLPHVFYFSALAIADCIESETLVKKEPRLESLVGRSGLAHLDVTRNVNFPSWMKSFGATTFFSETIVCIEKTDELISQLNSISREKDLAGTFCHMLRFIIYLYIKKMHGHPVMCISKYEKEKFKKIKVGDFSSDTYGYYDLFDKYNFHFILPN